MNERRHELPRRCPELHVVDTKHAALHLYNILRTKYTETESQAKISSLNLQLW